MKKIEVVAAVLKQNSEVLCLQRGFSKLDYISHKFEFPGGKVEENEDFKKALSRELLEEMNICVNEDQMSYLMTVNHQYPDFFITMHAYLCDVENIEYALNEHIDAVWSNAESIDALDWAAADIPIVDRLKSERLI